jgi:lipoprotein-anchoring transpeptidase ErfK/SrfK
VSRHRSSSVRPRYGRLAALGVALAVTLIAVLGSLGAFPDGGDPAPAAADIGAPATSRTPSGPPTPSVTATPSETASETASEVADPAALPADSGEGKRVVFSEEAQRVWLVGDDEQVRRTYLVSGSVTDNLHAGTYAVYSKSRWAVGINDSGVMEYFVRFAQGPSGAAIGFHTIPTKDGSPLQTKAQLGTPQSHGCIRQKTADAIALWDFAPVGGSVVVTA